MIKLYSLQYTRAIAALLVVIYHVTKLIDKEIHYQYLNGIFMFGYMGVDLFFILSGFIIYYIHHSDIGNRSRLKPYYLKRFTRVFPVYWIVLLPVAVMHWVLTSFGEAYEKSLPALIQSFFLVPDSHSPILNVAWTLKHEIYFYLLFGLFLIFIKNRAVSYGFVGAWIIMTLFFTAIPTTDSWSILTFLFSPHNLEFLSGVVIAYLLLTFKIDPGTAKTLMIVGCSLMLLSWFNEYFALAQIHRVISWGFPAALIILACASLDLSRSVKPNKTLLLLGDASYSIYLTHTPLIYFFILAFKKLNIFGLFGNVIGTTLCATLTVMLGCFFYKIIEKPVLHRAKLLIVTGRSLPHTDSVASSRA